MASPLAHNPLESRINSAPLKTCSSSSSYSGPHLYLESQRIAHQYRSFQQALPMVNPYYAVKANPHPDIIRLLDRLGCSFDIASEGELALLQGLGIHPRKILFSNPIKSTSSLVAARDYGILWYACDSLEELQKLSHWVPDGQYELRLQTDGRGSVWPLDNKFGVDMDEARGLIDYAAQHQLPLSGLTFHVGSQCTASDSWLRAIHNCRELLQYMQAQSLSPRLLNIGGGFPSAIHRDIPDIESLTAPLRMALHETIKSLPGNPLIAAEPGRFLVADAGTLHCQVIATASRHGEPWAYLDCGYYNGLMELNEAFGFQLRNKSRGGAVCSWTVAGPSCDSIDVFAPRYLLPANTRCGDLIEIPHMGAYCVSCASEFNGFCVPEVVFS